MPKPVVILTRRWPDAVEAQLEQQYELHRNHSDEPMTADQLRDALTRADALCATVTDNLSASVLDVPNLRTRIIGNFGVGFNHIDIDAATRLGIKVSNTPDVLTDCTADLAMTLMLMVARRAGEGERFARGGQWTGWRPTQMMGTRVTGKTLGIIGLGRIGAALARRARFGFGMKIIYHNSKPASAGNVQSLDAVFKRDLDDLLMQADFVSLHCPSTPQTRNLIDATRLSKMKPGAYLINTARGDIVDEAALIQALTTGGGIAGAGLDVYAAEPVIPEALCNLDNVVLLPHLGSATVETRTAMGERVIKNLNAFYADQPLPDAVVKRK